MSDYDEIDEELARKFLEDPDNVNLSEATKITDKAAHLLASHKGRLDLWGLSEISLATARHLSMHEGSPDAMEGLSIGIKELSDEIAKQFGQYKGCILTFDELEDLSDDSAQHLSHFHGDGLEITTLKSLTENAASYLMITKVSFITLGRDEGPSYGRYLEASGTKLSDTVIEILSKFDGDLTLGGLEELSDAVAKTLSKFKGQINCMDPNDWVETKRESLN